MRTRTKQDGLTLLITILLTSVVLAISATLMNITIKQFQLSGIARSSEVAFHAAHAGVECGLYFDLSRNDGDTFDVPHAGVALACMGDTDTEGASTSGDPQTYEFDWGTGDDQVCTNLTVYKIFDASNPVTIDFIAGVPTRICPVGVECTVIQSRGYNRECSAIQNSIRVVEREITYVY